MKKEIVKVSLSELKPFPGNPRHNQKSALKVAESIKEYGYINPIVVDENNVILAGNTRFKALGILGIKEIDVLKVTGLTEKQKNGFVIADNKVAEFSKWNWTQLERMLMSDEINEEILEDFGLMSVTKTKQALEKLIYEEEYHDAW